MVSQKNIIHQQLSKSSNFWNMRMCVPLTLLGLLLFPETRGILISILADAFWQVSTYVAGILSLFLLLSEQFRKRSGALKKTLLPSPILQVVFSSFMGSLPGCGGAIVVITQYVKGNLSFGSVVAVLTATMGDAAFILWFQEPYTGFFVTIVCGSVGLLYGIFIDLTHNINFMRDGIEKQDYSPIAIFKSPEKK